MNYSPEFFIRTKKPNDDLYTVHTKTMTYVCKINDDDDDATNTKK